MWEQLTSWGIAIRLMGYATSGWRDVSAAIAEDRSPCEHRFCETHEWDGVEASS